MHLELKKIRTALVAAEIILIRHGELFTPLAAACSQYSTPISCRHALTETVLILSLSDRRLECLFHLYYNFDPKTPTKIGLFWEIDNSIFLTSNCLLPQ